MFKYLLSLWVIPHGITDIILSYERNMILEMFLFYFVTPLTIININKSLYRLLFLSSSIIHFSHDIYPIIPYFIMRLYFTGYSSYYESLKYIVYYLSFIHVPYHYMNIFMFTNYIYHHIFLIFCMTLISTLSCPLLIEWIDINSGEDKLSKYIGGIILSHIFFNEYVYIGLNYNYLKI